MTPCSIRNCPHPGRLTVRIHRPGWAVPETRRVCRKHYGEIQRARLAAEDVCAVPGCPNQKLARHLCAEHIDAAYPIGALGLYGWWPTSDRRPTKAEVRRLVEALRQGRAA